MGVPDATEEAQEPGSPNWVLRPELGRILMEHDPSYAEGQFDDSDEGSGEGSD